MCTVTVGTHARLYRSNTHRQVDTLLSLIKVLCMYVCYPVDVVHQQCCEGNANWDVSISTAHEIKTKLAFSDPIAQFRLTQTHCQMRLLLLRTHNLNSLKCTDDRNVQLLIHCTRLKILHSTNIFVNMRYPP